MNTCFLPIKGKIQISVIIINLISFIIITLITNNIKSNYMEYTTLSIFCSNFYIFFIYTITLIHSIYPKIICKFITNNLLILTTDKGKIIINLSIGILFWSSNNMPHLIFSIINFVSSLALFLCELIFQCKILNNKNYDKEKNNVNKNNSY